MAIEDIRVIKKQIFENPEVPGLLLEPIYTSEALEDGSGGTIEWKLKVPIADDKGRNIGWELEGIVRTHSR